MFEEWQSNAPTEEYAKAAYYLEKELGLSHSDIFGGKEVILTEDGLEEVETTGMNVFTFMAYIELMEMDAEEQEQQRKQARQGNKVGQSKM